MTIDELEVSTKKLKTEDVLRVEEFFSEPLSNKNGERKIREGLITITPEVAKFLLTRNPNNRNLKDGHVGFLVKEMKEGRWLVNGESIKVDYNGELVDGQHRLTACVQTGIPMRTMFVFGISPSSINTIDTGSKRIAKDCLDMNNIPNSSLMASTIKLVNQFERGSYSELGSASRVMSNQQVIDYFDNNQIKLEGSVNIGMNLYKKCNKIVSSSIIAGLHFLFEKKSKQQAEEFFTKLCTGIGLEEYSPITALRNKLTREAVDGTKSLSQKDKVQNIIFAWNKYRNGEKCKLIKVPQDIKLTIQ